MKWTYEHEAVDWNDLSELFRIAPLGEKHPDDLRVVFTSSKYRCFVYDGERLVGAGRALADGRDCSYVCDVAVVPELQGKGLGRAIVEDLVKRSAGHQKIILYANPGTEAFYEKLGFRPMRTAFAIFRDRDAAIAKGVIAG